ncbi:MAG: MerR family transcriptional regulator [Candidatus Limnocylindria bacterium]
MSPRRPPHPLERPGRSATEWVSLGDASRLLGVSTATVRRWADAGRLKPFTTPGGHRRFSRAALERMLPDDRGRRPDLAAAGLTPSRLSRAYQRGTAPVVQQMGWLAALAPEDRDDFRQLGRRLAWELIAHLDASEAEARQHHLTEATAVAVEYGRRGADLGLAMSDVVEGFLAFRRPFLAEIGSVVRRRGFDTEEATRLFAEADRALDRLLVATMSGHSIRAGAPSRGATGRQALQRPPGGGS